MLYYAVVFFIIALIAALFGFGGIAAGAAGIAKILFVVFLIVSLVTFLLSCRNAEKELAMKTMQTLSAHGNGGGISQLGRPSRRT
jgi:uncharacterized membrane protein YtjA (UPF0391 family)